MHLLRDAFEIQIQSWPGPHAEPHFMTTHFTEVLNTSVSRHN